MTTRTLKKVLKDALEDLKELDFEKFCHELVDRRAEPRVLRSRVEGKSFLQVADVLVSTFTESGALLVAADILRQIGCNDEAQRLEGSSPSSPAARLPLCDAGDEGGVCDAVRKLSLAQPSLKTSLSRTGPEPETRTRLLRYSCDVTLDPNTTNKYLLLSEDGRKVTKTGVKQPCGDHGDRFIKWPQALSAERLSGRCYWEVEMQGEVCVGVAYRSISRTGSQSALEAHEESWALSCYKKSYTFWDRGVRTLVSGPPSCRVGVFLDHDEGVLSFYSVSETWTLLHRVQTSFTEPLHAGLRLYTYGGSAEFSKPKH